MSAELPQGMWKEVEAILVINMKHRTDRWDALMETLDKVGVRDKVVRIEAVAGKELSGFGAKPWFTGRTSDAVAANKAGAAGCALSHKKAVAYAKAHGLKQYLMLEDDARFDDLLQGREGEMVAEIIREPCLWDLFYLGFYQRVNMHHTVKEEDISGRKFEIRRMRGPLLTHAFFVNSSIYDAMLAEMPTEETVWAWIAYWGSVDSWIYNKFGRAREVKVWGTMPRLVNQAADFSDISGRMQSEDESRGLHRKSTLIPKSLAGLESSLDRSVPEGLYQFFKRGGRRMRAQFNGFHKS